MGKKRKNRLKEYKEGQLNSGTQQFSSYDSNNLNSHIVENSSEYGSNYNYSKFPLVFFDTFFLVLLNTFIG